MITARASCTACNACVVSKWSVGAFKGRREGLASWPRREFDHDLSSGPLVVDFVELYLPKRASLATCTSGRLTWPVGASCRAQQICLFAGPVVT